MKIKTKRILFALFLVFALCATALSAFAEEADVGETTPPTSEPPIEGVETGETGTETTDTPAEEDKSFYADWIDRISGSTVWISIASFAVAALGMIAFVRSRFGVVIDLVKRKADAATIGDAVKSAVNDIVDRFTSEMAKTHEELENVRQKLDSAESNEKKLTAILSIFMTNAKINPNARAKIIEYLTGIADLTGTVQQIVEQANKEIAAAEKSEEKPETPALDAVLAAEKKEETIGIGVI